MKYTLLIYFYILSISAYSQINSEKEIVSRMLNASENLHTAKYSFHTEELLVNGSFEITDRLVKLQAKPKNIYFYSQKPNPGTEIIWKEGWKENKMLVSPGSFPFVTFTMKPTSSLARKNSHHSIVEMGFNYMNSLVVHYQKAYGDKFYDYCSIVDTVQWDGRSCIRFEFDFKDYSVIKYTVRKNENVSSIAKKLFLNDYSILILNHSISDYDDVKEGQVIKIPNSYGKKIEFYIDRFSWLPIRQQIFNSNGLYEKYEIKSLFVNPKFKDEEFTPEYKEYKF